MRTRLDEFGAPCSCRAASARASERQGIERGLLAGGFLRGAERSLEGTPLELKPVAAGGRVEVGIDAVAGHQPESWLHASKYCAARAGSTP
ncbi:MAG TPA: hypothetical protein VMM93_12150 [Vicinamibacterales bacterium]|nr:hypothetical protein [Vicinamibacterales bacterium]